MPMQLKGPDIRHGVRELYRGIFPISGTEKPVWAYSLWRHPEDMSPTTSYNDPKHWATRGKHVSQALFGDGGLEISSIDERITSFRAFLAFTVVFCFGVRAELLLLGG